LSAIGTAPAADRFDYAPISEFANTNWGDWRDFRYLTQLSRSTRKSQLTRKGFLCVLCEKLCGLCVERGSKHEGHKGGTKHGYDDGCFDNLNAARSTAQARIPAYLQERTSRVRAFAQPRIQNAPSRSYEMQNGHTRGTLSEHSKSVN